MVSARLGAPTRIEVMKTPPAVLSLALPLLLASAPCTQDAPAMPNPKHAQHDALKPFVGTWNCNVKMNMGGQVIETTAVETVELVCNGLWLKSTVNSTLMGQPFQGITLLGYDSKRNTHVSVWADSMAPIATQSDVAIDGKARTWTSKTTAGHGPTRSVMVWKSNDHIVETAYAQGEDGKETEMMWITRQRATGAPSTAATTTASVGTPANASGPGAGPAAGPAGGPAGATASGTTTAAAAPALTPVQQSLARSLGQWNVVTKMTTPDGTETEEAGNEVCLSVCNGLWQWTDFKGQFMGAPFEGHALFAHQPEGDAVTTFWIDSTSPFLTKMTGKYDATSKSVICKGPMLAPTGEEGTITEKQTWKGENTRVSEFSITGSNGETFGWSMTATRATPKPGAAPRK